MLYDIIDSHMQFEKCMHHWHASYHDASCMHYDAYDAYMMGCDTSTYKYMSLLNMLNNHFGSR